MQSLDLQRVRDGGVPFRALAGPPDAHEDVVAVAGDAQSHPLEGRVLQSGHAARRRHDRRSAY